MTSRPYTVVIEQDPETGWLVGEVVELPSCYTAAPDLPTLEANIREVVKLYLEVTGDPEPESLFFGTMRLDIPA